jgi:hypothetical protein
MYMYLARCDNLRVDHDGAIPKAELNGSGELPRTKSSLVNGLWIEVTLGNSFAKMRVLGFEYFRFTDY